MNGYYVCSFPRSGTHLCINTIVDNFGYEWSDLKGTHDWAYYKKMFSQIDNYNGLVKTHGFYDLLKLLPCKPIIFVIRHPFDVALSFYDYLQRDEFYLWNEAPDIRGMSFESFINNPFPNWHFDQFTKLERRKDLTLFDYWNAWIVGMLKVQRKIKSIFILYEDLNESKIDDLTEFLGEWEKEKVIKPDLKNSFSHLPNKGISNRFLLEEYKNQLVIMNQNNAGGNALKLYEDIKKHCSN